MAFEGKQSTCWGCTCGYLQVLQTMTCIYTLGARIFVAPKRRRRRRQLAGARARIAVARRNGRETCWQPKAAARSIDFCSRPQLFFIVGPLMCHLMAVAGGVAHRRLSGAVRVGIGHDVATGETKLQWMSVNPLQN